MSRVHDMGGRFGDGPVVPDAPGAEVFEEVWHARALAVTLACGALGQWNIDISRHARERLSPRDYSRFSYYEKWISALADLLVETGVLTREDLTGESGSSPDDLASKALKADQVAGVLAKGGPASRDSDIAALFAPGDQVATRAIAENTLVDGGHRPPPLGPKAVVAGLHLPRQLREHRLARFGIGGQCGLGFGLDGGQSPGELGMLRRGVLQRRGGGRQGCLPRVLDLEHLEQLGLELVDQCGGLVELALRALGVALPRLEETQGVPLVASPLVEPALQGALRGLVLRQRRRGRGLAGLGIGDRPGGLGDGIAGLVAPSARGVASSIELVDDREALQVFVHALYSCR